MKHKAKPKAALIVTHRLLEQGRRSDFGKRNCLSTKDIVIGMGCNRGTPAEEIEQVIDETLAELNISIKSVKALCTIDLKKDEVGLLKW